jgi:hypothetical protein
MLLRKQGSEDHPTQLNLPASRLWIFRTRIFGISDFRQLSHRQGNKNSKLKLAQPFLVPSSGCVGRTFLPRGFIQNVSFGPGSNPSFAFSRKLQSWLRSIPLCKCGFGATPLSLLTPFPSHPFYGNVTSCTVFLFRVGSLKRDSRQWVGCGDEGRLFEY